MISSVTSAAQPFSPATERHASVVPLFLLPAVFLLIRALFVPTLELAGDEAYYWTWSRNLECGYFDHPPLIAWLIRGSTAMLGNTAFGVRLPAILCATGTIVAATLGLHLAGADRRTLWIVQVLFFLSPMIQLAGAIMTPDAPSLLFTTAALAAAMAHLKTQSWRSALLVGLFGGLAMLSKYPALLPTAVILLFLLPRGKKLHVVAAGLIALLLITPMLWWNYRHDWISFVFQFHHGLDAVPRPWWANLADSIGLQFLVATPVLFVLMLLAAGRAILRPAPAEQRLLAVAGLVSVVVFLGTGVRHRIEANWPALAWPPLLMLLALTTAEAGQRWRKWQRGGLIVAGCFVLVPHLPPALIARFDARSPMARFGSWRMMASEIRRRAGDLPIVSTRYQEASLLSFYLPGQPEIRVIRPMNERPSQYDLMLPAPVGEILLANPGGLPGPEDYSVLSGGRPYTLSSGAASFVVIELDEVSRQAFVVQRCRLTAVQQP